MEPLRSFAFFCLFAYFADANLIRVAACCSCSQCDVCTLLVATASMGLGGFCLNPETLSPELQVSLQSLRFHVLGATSSRIESPKTYTLNSAFL